MIIIVVMKLTHDLSDSLSREHYKPNAWATWGIRCSYGLVTELALFSYWCSWHIFWWLLSCELLGLWAIVYSYHLYISYRSLLFHYSDYVTLTSGTLKHWDHCWRIDWIGWVCRCPLSVPVASVSGTHTPTSVPTTALSTRTLKVYK